MNTPTDQQLLQDYAAGHSEPAFAELVRRHADLVHSAARRMVCDAHLAGDVTQAVFVALAQNARQLTGHPVLAGWLHRTTQNLAANIIRANVRRQAREQAAATMNELLAAAPDASWEHIAPHLDAALGELGEPDRDALLLRYFEGKSAQEMAQILGISDEAAQKRVRRAIEKLREFFSKRKITVGAGGLAVLISANAVQTAPVGLAATISATALSAGTAVHTSTVFATTKTIAMTTLQKTLVTATIAVLAGAGIYEARQAAQLREQVQTLQQSQAPLAEQLQQLQNSFAAATNRLVDLLAENSRFKLNSNPSELLKLRGEIGVLRNQADDPTQTAAKAWFDRVKKLKQRLTEKPDASIPELQLLEEEDWLAAVKTLKLNSENDFRRAESNLRSAAENKFGGVAHSALNKYLQANGHQFPTDMAQLQPYFDSPVDDLILQRWEIVPASVVANVGVGNTIITQKAPVDDLLDSRLAIGANGYGNTDWLQSETQDILKPVIKAFKNANPNVNWDSFDFPQYLPFATTPEQRVAVQKLIDQQALRK